MCTGAEARPANSFLMKKKLLTASAFWFLCWAAAGAETWGEVWSQAHQQSVAILQQLPKTWSGEGAANDLDRLIETLSQLQSRADWSPEELRDLRLQLNSERQGLRVSLAAASVEGAESLLSRVEQIENGLTSAEESFGGAHVPTPHELASSDVQRSWKLPGYDSPQELERVARSIRLDVNSLWGPFRFGGAGLGYGLFGGGYGSGFTAADRQRLVQAAYRYERACAHYRDVEETYPAFVELSNAYDRISIAGIYSSLSIRSIERQIERLRSFYAELEKQDRLQD